MYQVGDVISYGSTGVCEVVEVAPEKQKGANPERLFYTLRPLYSSEIIYTPVDTRVFMRPALSRQEAEDLIQRIPSIEEQICTERSLTMLREHYERCLQSHMCEELVQLIKGIWAKSRKAERNGKKPGQMDLRYQKRAEDLLHGELAAALGIERSQVTDYIHQQIEKR